jgi:hypothetical protein
VTNGDPDAAKVQLAKAVTAANQPPNPPSWVQKWQIFLALASFVGAFAVALVLILHGPPAPKTPEASDSEATPSSKPSGQPTSIVLTAAGDSAPQQGDSGNQSGSSGSSGEPAPDNSGEPSTSGEPPESDQGQGDEESEEGSSADSLANLNEQAPWAFAIVALLVGAFLATGKSLNFGGAGGPGNP